VTEFDYPPTMCAGFQRTAATYPDDVALRTPGDTQTVTWRQYADRVRAIACGLAWMGVGHGDTVGLMLTNRPEFHLVDTAALHLGAVPFSIYNTNPAETIAHLFGNARNRVVVTERQFLDRILAAQTKGTGVEHIILVDDDAVPGTIRLADLETTAPPPGFDFEASWRTVHPSDLMTIIYTSGTTGTPKGVELTHANVVANIRSARELVDPTVRHRVVSYLPDAHVVNRWACHWLPMLSGSQVTCLSDTKGVLTALAEVRPTAFVAVPQVWYKLRAGVEAALRTESNPVRQRLGRWALDVGVRYARLAGNGRPVPPSLQRQYQVADRLVLSKIRRRLGIDQVGIAASGAAPISAEALEFVIGLGIPVSEAWGMSELTAIGTANRPGATRIGTVGRPVPGLEAKLADDGELLVRGPSVMRGYRGDPAATAAAIDAAGWLHTGDVATIDDDGYVTIVDRKKELIITSAGKNMSPTRIEGVVKAACPLAGSVVAIGDERPYVTALLTLDPDISAAYAAERGLDPAPATLAMEPGLRLEIAVGMDLANQKLSRVEQIKRWEVVPTVWEPGGDELTPTMKLRRKPILAKYASEIDGLYVG
jgi:long-chain acyl-CoA synthetase